MRETQRQREDKVYYLHLQLTRIFRLVWPRSTRGSITYRSSYLTRTHWWQVDCIRCPKWKAKPKQFMQQFVNVNEVIKPKYLRWGRVNWRQERKRRRHHKEAAEGEVREEGLTQISCSTLSIYLHYLTSATVYKKSLRQIRTNAQGDAATTTIQEGNISLCQEILLWNWNQNWSRRGSCSSTWEMKREGERGEPNERLMRVT